VFLGDTLYEIDVEGVKPPRMIMEKMGGLNGFEFGPDDMLYGPLWFKGQVAKVDVDKPELTVVADGSRFRPPSISIPKAICGGGYRAWPMVRVDPKTGAKKMVAQLKPSLDNLAIDDKDRIFVSNMADNGIQEVDPETGVANQVIIGKLALPAASPSFPTGPRTRSTSPTCSPIAPSTEGPAKFSEPARMHAMA